jgi:hypothetical protein
MELRQVTTAIMWGNWTTEELNSMIESIKFARNQLARKNIGQIRVGDSVEFTSTKTGQTVQGFVTKIAVKYVTVKSASGLWRVPASMLNPIELMVA